MRARSLDTCGMVSAVVAEKALIRSIVVSHDGRARSD